jgi:predicted dehydrogenase
MNESDEVDLMAIVDPDAAAQRVAQISGARWVPSVEHLLDSEEIDFCVVAVPTGEHASVATALVDAGIAVLVEKPIASDVPSATRLLEAARRQDVVLAVGHVERFNPAVRELERRLEAAELGRVFQVHARRLSPFPSRVRDAGVALDLATHDLDIMSRLAGSPVRISAETDSRTGEGRDDLLAAVLRYDTGVIGVLEVNWLTPTKVRRLTATGERGMFVVDYLNQHLTLYENALVSERWHPLDLFDGVTEGNVVRFAIQREEPLRAQLDAFVAAVRGRDPVRVSGDDGLRVLQLADAVIEAATRGRTVELGGSAAADVDR